MQGTVHLYLDSAIMGSQMLHRTFNRMRLSGDLTCSAKKATPAQLTAFDRQALRWKPSLSSSSRRNLQQVDTAGESGHASIQPLIGEDEVKLENVSMDGDAFGNVSSYKEWDSLTGKLAGSATLAFLLLQLPQIILNFQNLRTGNTTALFAVPWMGQLTGLLGNLSLLSYFAKKREVGAMVVQAVGVVSTWVVLLQLTMAGAMPSLAFTVTATAVGLGLLFNFLNYNKLLSLQIWELWEDAITIGGLSVLPQVMWSTFEAVLPPSLLPGLTSMIVALSLVVLRRLEKLPPSATTLLASLSAWTATLLFMWAPVAQMWTNYLNPANIRGLSVFTVLLAMIGNSLLLPRALFTRDKMWFTGASWGTLFQGWAILVTMYINKCIPDAAFYGACGMLAVWLGMILVKDKKAHSLSSPLSPLVELFLGKTAQAKAQ